MNGSLFDDALKALFEEIWKRAIDAAIVAGKRIITRPPTDDWTAQAAQRYRDSLEKRPWNIQILRMHQGRSLSDLYIKSRLSRRIRSRRQLAVNDVQNQILTGNQEPVDAVEPLDVIVPGSRVVVLGRPGAGKTTLLRTVLTQSLSASEPLLPVYIPLRELALKNIPLRDYIVDEFSQTGVPTPAAFVDAAMTSGKCIILMDGLDEVPAQHLNRVIVEINQLVARQSVTPEKATGYIVTCRVGFYEYWLESFEVVELLEFSELDIVRFVGKWFADDSTLHEKSIAELQRAPRLLDIAKTPLLLALYCITFGELRRSPENRAEFYKDALDVLIDMWDARRFVDRADAVHMAKRRKEALLRTLAVKAFENGARAWNEDDLIAQIDDWLCSRPGAVDSESIDGAVVLRSIEANHGILTKQADGIYAFAHLGFHEYYVALDKSTDPIAQRAMLNERLHDEGWREVIILTSALLRDADGYIRHILTQSREATAITILTADLRGVIDRLRSSGPYTPVQTRAQACLYIFLQLSFWGRAVDDEWALLWPGHAGCLDLLRTVARATGIDGQWRYPDRPVSEAPLTRRALDPDTALMAATIETDWWREVAPYFGSPTMASQSLYQKPLFRDDTQPVSIESDHDLEDALTKREALTRRAAPIESHLEFMARANEIRRRMMLDSSLVSAVHTLQSSDSARVDGMGHEVRRLVNLGVKLEGTFRRWLLLLQCISAGAIVSVAARDDIRNQLSDDMAALRRATEYTDGA